MPPKKQKAKPQPAKQTQKSNSLQDILVKTELAKNEREQKKKDKLEKIEKVREARKEEASTSTDNKEEGEDVPSNENEAEPSTPKTEKKTKSKKNDEQEEQSTDEEKDDAKPEKKDKSKIKDEEKTLAEFQNIQQDSTISAGVEDGTIHLVNSYVEATTIASRTKNLEVRDAFEFQTTLESLAYFGGIIQPFKISTEIPRFFEFYVTKSDLQDPNPKSNLISMISDKVPQIKESCDIFNTTTLTVRIKLREKINGFDINPPNDIQDGVIQIKQVYAPNTDIVLKDLQPLVNMWETRLFNLIQIFKATESILYQIPQKTGVTGMSGPSFLHNTLSNFSRWEGDYANIFDSAFANPNEWYQQELLNLFNEAQTTIGETNVVTYYNKKISSRIQAITDQFATAIAALNYNRLNARQLSVPRYLDRIRANMFDGDDVMAAEYFYENVLSLLYSPTRQEWNVLMLMLLTNRKVKGAVFSAYTPILEGTNIFSSYGIAEVVANPVGGNPQTNQVFLTWLNSLSVGNTRTAYDLILFETFPDWFDFKLNFGKTAPDDSAIIEFVNVCTFVVIFPRLAQATVAQWGYRLMSVLNTLIPTQYRAWTNAFGEIRYQGRATDMEGVMLTSAQSQAGYVYSILDPNVVNGGRVSGGFFDFILHLRARLTPNLAPVNLDRKRNAGYPYYADNYQAYMSWPFLNLAGRADLPNTQWSTRLVQILDSAQALLLRRYNRVEDRGGMEKGMSAFMSTFFDNMKRLYKTVSTTFQSSGYRLQNAIMNSFAFVYDSYDPVRPFNMPTPIVMAPSENRQRDMGVPIQKAAQVSLDPAIATRFALTLEGQYSRGLLNKKKPDDKDEKLILSPPREASIIEGHVLDDLALGLIKKAREFGTAFQFVRWITNNAPNDNNPLGQLTTDLQPIMRMSVWAPLVQKVFERFDLDFQDYFVDVVRPTSGALDGRYLDVTLKRVDTATMRPAVNQPIGTIFGQRYEFIDEFTRETIRILSRIVVSPDSPVLNYVRGGYIGKFYVSELQPFQPNILDGWIIADEFELSTRPVKGGQAHRIIVRYDGDEHTFNLPHDARMPKIILELPNLSAIPLSYRRDIAKAIHSGHLALNITNLRITYEIMDKSSRTEDYSRLLSVDDIFSLITVPDGSLMNYVFETTTYSSNFVLNAFTVPEYIQWVATYADVDKNLHAAVLASGTARAQNTRLPSVHELAYGLPGNDISRRLAGGEMKINASVINWNNDYPAIGKDLQTARLTLEYVPMQPMDYDLFVNM